MNARGWPFLAVAAFLLLAGGVKIGADEELQTETAVAIACGCILLGAWIVTEAQALRRRKEDDDDSDT